MNCSWNTRIDNPQIRFQVLNEFDDEAVLDKETGLVWERKPSVTAVPWPNARLICAQKAVGKRGGWRLPSFSELATLIDPSVVNAAIPRLPSGHPFLGVQASEYWTATVFAEAPGFTMVVIFRFIPGSEAPIAVNDASINGSPKHVWAVRGISSGPAAY